MAIIASWFVIKVGRGHFALSVGRIVPLSPRTSNNAVCDAQVRTTHALHIASYPASPFITAPTCGNMSLAALWPGEDL